MGWKAWIANLANPLLLHEASLLRSENDLLKLLKTTHQVQCVRIGEPPLAEHAMRKTKYSWKENVGGGNNAINTLIAGNIESPPLVMLHGYGAAHGFFFRNYDALAQHFRVYSIDQLGWGRSSRPAFKCANTEETDDWFVESLEKWRVAMDLDKFVLVGHSFGGYVGSRYALKYPDHVRHLILFGPAGFAEQSATMAKFRSTLMGSFVGYLWDRDFRPQLIIRALGWWGPSLVAGYTSTRFGSRSQGIPLSAEENRVFTEYLYRILTGPSSGELCLSKVFSLGAFARQPLCRSADKWKVPTTFCYGDDDWMDYEAGVKAAEIMPVATVVLRMRNAGHFSFLDNPAGFLEATLLACHSSDDWSWDRREMLENRVVHVSDSGHGDSNGVQHSSSLYSHKPNSVFTPGRNVATRWKMG